jgi:hypothetical protein
MPLRVARYCELAVNPDTVRFTAIRNDDEHAKAARRDSCYLIKTDRDDLSMADF